jgi:competence protein ComEC
VAWENWLVWLPVFLGLGIAGYFALPFEPEPRQAVGLIVAAGLAALLTRRRTVLFLISVSALVAAVGLGAAVWRTERVAAPILGAETGPAEVSGIVRRVEHRADGGARVTLDHVSIQGASSSKTPRTIRLTARTNVTALPGEQAGVRALLLPIPQPSVPGVYDFARDSWFDGLGGLGIALGPVAGQAPLGGVGFASRIRNGVTGLRDRLSARIRAAAPTPAGAMAAALMVGDRGAIPEDVTTALRDAGLAHLLAISGLHMGLMAGIAFFAVRALLALNERLALRYPIKKFAAVAGILCGALYLMVTGAPIPTQRSFIMVGIVFAAILLDRTALSMRLVALAATIILLIAPESLLDVSFQMSFAAVIALIALYDAMKHRLAAWRASFTTPLGRAGFYLAGVALTTLVAQAAIDPIAVYQFGRMVLYGLAANIIAVPVTGLWIMPWALVAFLLMPFGLESLALTPMCWGLNVVIWVAKEVSSWPGAVVLVKAWPVTSLAFIALGGLWLCLWPRRSRLLGLGVAATGILIGILSPVPDILINGDGSLIAARGPDGRYAFSSLARESYDRETWLRLNGQKAATGWPLEPAADPPGDPAWLRCDALGCVYRPDGAAIVAFSLDPRALEEDCTSASLIVATVPVPRRCRTDAIDRFDLWRNGGYAIRFGGTGFKIKSVADQRGDRPWVLNRERRRPDEKP